MLKNREKNKEMALRRIHYLNDLLFTDNDIDKSTIVRQMENISIRFDLTLPMEIKRSFCKKCKTPYDEKMTLRCRNSNVVLKCGKCGDIRRIPYLKK